MKCPECRAENPDDAEFCSLCYARFQVKLRSSDVDEAAMLIREKHQGAKLRCPSCMALSPLDSQFCLNCGFVFEDLEALMVSEEEQERMLSEAQAALRKEEEKAVEAITITPESDGAAVMRSLYDHLRRGLKPRLHAKGRNSVTHAMKLAALLGEDMRAGGGDVLLKVNLVGEGSVTHLDDVELEIILESA